MHLSYIKKFIQGINKKYVEEAYNNEDKSVLTLLRGLPKGKYFYLEVGSGLGRFPVLLSNLEQTKEKFAITCLEINKNLSDITRQAGFETIMGNFLDNNFENEFFDIAHCSHFIEHFKYPESAQILDELARITKKGGFIIIRSPLMHYNFYRDIDHVRPYPPECILSYFNNSQRQRVGNCAVKEIKRWHRRGAVMIRILDKSSLIRAANLLLKIFWIYFKFPFSKINGYVLILQKQ